MLLTLGSKVRIFQGAPIFSIKFCLELNKEQKSGYRIMAITSAFQADDTGSTPVVRSNLNRGRHFACLFSYL